MTFEEYALEELWKPLAVEIARLCEMNYRRGFSDGAESSEDGRCDVLDAEEWRNDYDPECEFNNPPPIYKNWRQVQCHQKNRISTGMTKVRIADDLVSIAGTENATFPLLNSLFARAFEHSEQRKSRKPRELTAPGFYTGTTSPAELASVFDTSKFAEGVLEHKAKGG